MVIDVEKKDISKQGYHDDAPSVLQGGKENPALALDRVFNAMTYLQKQMGETKNSFDYN